MIFRQLFDGVSHAFTYLIGSGAGGEALIIDPVLEKVDRYIQLLDELDLKLAKALDTHVHADHITGLGALRDRTRCVTVMGRKSRVDVVSMRIEDGDRIEVADIVLEAIHTPGHTDDSYSFRMSDRVFTGDTLLIRGTGRTDFQNGDPWAAYDSLFNKLLTLPGDTLVYPGHDYKGDTLSTIAEEKAHNPRLQVASAPEYAEIMNNLDLEDPKMMDVAVPANLSIGFSLSEPLLRERTLFIDQALDWHGRADVFFVDLREDGERRHDGVIPGSYHAPYRKLDEHVAPAGVLKALALQANKKLVLYCAFGERSALAVKTLHEAGVENVHHLGGGLAAWIKGGGRLVPPADDV